MIEVPDGSIYFWMYEQGLKHVNLTDVEFAVLQAGKHVRDKDRENYWNGYFRSDLYHGKGNEDIFLLTRQKERVLGNASQEFFSTAYYDYPDHPYGNSKPEIGNRWVPCNKDNKPMIKWSKGCMTIADAIAYKDQIYLAENLKGTRFIVIDCDGDHGNELDLETMYFLNRWRQETHCLVKPGAEFQGVPVSFHLTFKVDKIIPTMHFPYAHIDIVGNRRNSLRYWKNKQWNHIEPDEMTWQRWQELQEYVKYRKEKANA